jgi:hypothetical protein
MRNVSFVLVAIALFFTACGTEDPLPKDTGDGGGDAVVPADGVTPDGGETVDPACEIGGDIVCCPGQTNGCSDDQQGVFICAEDGTGWVSDPCTSAAGEATICLSNVDNPEGYCTECKPGQKRCQDDDVVLICAEDGTGWVEFSNCNGGITGMVCVENACVELCEINVKRNIYMGCDFWGVDLDNAFVPGGRTGFYDAAGSQYSIVVSNPSAKYPATISVSGIEGEILFDSDDNPFPTAPLQPGQLRIYNLPRRDADGTVVAPLAYRVRASIPITAYQFNPLANVDVFSNDASLLLPENVAGKYYFIMTREQTFHELRSYLTVAAVREGITQVTVDVTAPTLVGVNEKTGEPIPHLEPGETVTFQLEQFDVLNIETDAIGADMTGSVVLANRDVIVFGGSEASNAPNNNHCLIEDGEDEGVCEWDGETKCDDNSDCTSAGFNTCCADHLEQQLFPVKSWGTHYVASKSFPRNGERDVYRIMAAENNTLVTTLPVQVNIPVLNRGEWVDFESDANFEIKGTKPILVGQFLASEQAPDPNVGGVPGPMDAGIGDPAFLLLVPAEQFRQDYIFLAPDKYELDYATVVAPKNATVWVDCPELDVAKIPDTCPSLDEDEWSWYMSGEFKTAKFAIADGVHRIYADEPVSVYVYGYDQYVSYGYPAGLDIKDLGLIKEPGE